MYLKAMKIIPKDRYISFQGECFEEDNIHSFECVSPAVSVKISHSTPHTQRFLFLYIL